MFGRYLQSIFLVIFLVFLQACASSVQTIYKPTSLTDKAPYALVKVKNADYTTGTIEKLSTQPDFAVSKWEKVCSQDTSGKWAAKNVWAVTPYGMVANLIHNGQFFGTDSVYHVPAGEIQLLVLNMYRRTGKKVSDIVDNPEDEKVINLCPGADFFALKNVCADEFTVWVTTLKANLKPDEEYYLCACEESTDKSRFGKVNSYFQLLDNHDNNVVTEYEYLIPLNSVDMKKMVYKESVFVLFGGPAATGSIAGSETSATMKPQLEDLNRLLLDIEQGKYDQLSSRRESAEISPIISTSE